MCVLVIFSMAVYYILTADASYNDACFNAPVPGEIASSHYYKACVNL